MKLIPCTTKHVELTSIICNMEAHAIDCQASPIGREFHVRSRQNVSLGPIRLEICSNEHSFAGLRYFPRSRWLPPDSVVDHRLHLCNTELDGPWPRETLMRARDRSYRAGRFASGYYITDHFGAPAYLLTQGPDFWIFAPGFEAILWPYLVKHILTIYAIEHGGLHLKAAACVLDGCGSLLVARGGGGKTVLLKQLCKSGGSFLSNTHVLIRDGILTSVPTSMRVRKDSMFGPLIAARSLPPAIKPGEYTADPISDLGWHSTPEASARTICLVDHVPGRQVIRELDRIVLFDYMDQFALALNVYGLKEDILDHLGGDVGEFSLHTARMQQRLRALIEACASYYLSCDCTDPDTLKTVCALLRR